MTPQLRRFEQDVVEESGGKLKISSFINAQLGNEQDTVQQVARGRIDMGGFSNGAVALLAPELALLGLPFFFKSTAEQDCTVDAMTKPVSDLLAKKGVKSTTSCRPPSAPRSTRRSPAAAPRSCARRSAASRPRCATCM